LSKPIMKILGDPGTIKFVLKGKKIEVKRDETKLDRKVTDDSCAIPVS
jgi:hypothetical protein